MEQIHKLIYEYLSYTRFEKSIHEFELESAEKGIPLKSGTEFEKEKISALQNQFLQFFRDGDRNVFFNLWDEQFQEPLRLSDSVFQKIEFSLSIYFAIFPIHEFTTKTNALTLSQSMEKFKHYLETRGSSLCKSTQFLAYFALPYVPDPRKHPSFKELFEQEWILDLETRLLQFLCTSLTGKALPKLYQLVNQHDEVALQETKKQTQEIHKLERKIKDLLHLESEWNRKHRRLQTEYQNLITIASELVQALAISINGQKISPAYLSNICQRLTLLKNPDQIPTPIMTSPKIQLSKPMPKLPAIPSNNNHHTRKNIENPNQELDYIALKQDLLADIPTFERNQAFLLQALRHKLSKAHHATARRSILQDLTHHDIFNFSSGTNILTRALECHSELIKEQMVKLINVMASESLGREYLLCKKGFVVIHFIHALKREQTDSHYRQNIFGILQKLSLRRIAQSIMNSNHMIEHLFNLFADLDSLSEYTIEYASALLMNLCLRTLGKKACLQDPKRTLHVLNELIEHDNIQVKTYINGILFSILSEPTIREEARAIGLEEQLMYLKESSDEQLVGQIDFVLEKLNSDQIEDLDEASEDGEEDDDQEEDEDNQTVIDEDETEDLLPTETDLNGDLLLSKYQVPTQRVHHPKQEREAREPIEYQKPIPPAPLYSAPLPPAIGNANNMPPHHAPVAADGEEVDLIDMVPTITNRKAPLPVSLPYPKPKGKIPASEEEKTELDSAFGARPKLPRTPQSTTPIPTEPEYEQPKKFERKKSSMDAMDRLLLRATSRLSQK